MRQILSSIARPNVSKYLTTDTSEMLAEVLEERTIGTRVLPPIAVTTGALGQLSLDGVKVVCLSYFDYQPQVYARYICRRLRRRAPHIRLVVCCWNLPLSSPDSK